MAAIATRSVSRLAPRQAPLLAARPPIASTRLALRRGYATAGEGSTKKLYGDADHTHAVAGLAGGGSVLLLLYTWYHFSGTKKTINTAQQYAKQAEELKDKALSSTPDPKHLLKYLRSAVQTYGAAIPGLGYVIDQTFDQIDQLSDKHGDEVNKVLTAAYKEVAEAMSKGGEGLGDKVAEIAQRTLQQVQQVSGKVGTDLINPLLDSNPKLKDVVGDSLNQLKSLADRHGPQAKKLYDDTESQLKSLIDRGLNAGTLAEAAHLVRSRSREIAELAKDAAGDAWQEAAKRAKPYLDQLPEARDALDKALGPIKNQLGPEGNKLLERTYSDLERLGKQGVDKNSLKKASQLVQERVQELKELAKDKAESSGFGSALLGGGGAGALLSSIPGLDKISPDLDGLRKVVEKRGPEAEKLMNETYDEIVQILKRKAQDAKKLGEKTAQEGKDKAMK